MKLDWFNIFPYGAGSPPALVLGLHLYTATVTATGEAFWPIAALVSSVGIVSMMGIEISTYKMLARAVAFREWAAAVLAFLGAVAVTGLIVFSVYTGADTKSLLSSTLVMLVGYLALMVREYLETNKRERQRVKDEKAEAVRIANEKLAKENDTRVALAKIELSKERVISKRGASQPVQVVSTVDVHAGQFKVNPETVEKLRVFWKDNPEASMRQAAQACGCSPTTASKYKGV